MGALTLNMESDDIRHVVGRITSSAAGDAVEFATGGVQVASWTAVPVPNGSWPTNLVVAVEVRLDGENWIEVAAINATAAPSAVVCVWPEIRFRVKTVSSAGHSVVVVAFYGRAGPAT